MNPSSRRLALTLFSFVLIFKAHAEPGLPPAPAPQAAPLPVAEFPLDAKHPKISLFARLTNHLVQHVRRTITAVNLIEQSLFFLVDEGNELRSDNLMKVPAAGKHRWAPRGAADELKSAYEFVAVSEKLYSLGQAAAQYAEINDSVDWPDLSEKAPISEIIVKLASLKAFQKQCFAKIEAYLNQIEEALKKNPRAPSAEIRRNIATLRPDNTLKTVEQLVDDLVEWYLKGNFKHKALYNQPDWDIYFNFVAGRNAR